MQSTRLSRGKALFVLAASSIAFASCGGDSGPPAKPTVPVTGKLFVKAQPANGAIIYFRPQDGSPPESWTNGYPRATVAADGSFAVSTYDVADGAPPGEYQLVVTWPTTPPDPDGDDEEAPPDRLGGRYMNAETSRLRAKVEDKATELPRIDLK